MVAVTHDTPGWRCDLKIALAWALLCGLAAMAVVPYLMELMPQKFAALPMPLPAVIALQGAQAFVLLGAMALLGLRMGHRVALGSPLFRRWLCRDGDATLRAARPLQAIALGVAAGIAVLALAAVLDPMLPAMRNPPARADAATSVLNGLLAAFYGGIAEEVQLRMFLMTLLVWLVAKLRKATPQPAAYWSAIVLAAVLFGAAHLPAASHVWGLDAMVVSRTVLLNAVAGLAFGWLYWKRGLEMAVLAHFSTDIVLHVLPPLLHIGAPA